MVNKSYSTKARSAYEHSTGPSRTRKANQRDHFFAKNTRFLGKTKLCKLLYFLDFEHFKQTGRSVTGLEYFSWKMGPVPVALYEEVDMPEPDLADKVQFVRVATRNGEILTVIALAEFDSGHLSKRELRILTELATEFCETRAEDMIELTHLENQPWHKVYVEDGKLRELIPYELALRKQDCQDMLDVFTERKEFIEHFRQA